MKTAIKAVRDAIVDVVIAAWTDVTVSKEDPEKVHGGNFALVMLSSLTLEAETVGSDVATLTFAIGGRWATTLTADQKIDKVDALRSALLSTVNLGGYGYLSMVEGAELSPSGDLGEGTEIVVTFSCSVEAAR